MHSLQRNFKLSKESVATIIVESEKELIVNNVHIGLWSILFFSVVYVFEYEIGLNSNSIGVFKLFTKTQNATCSSCLNESLCQNMQRSKLQLTYVLEISCQN